MSEKDVKDNLVSIIDSMDRIRNETAANLGASDEAKMDYLRLAGELAGCAKVLKRVRAYYRIKLWNKNWVVQS